MTVVSFTKAKSLRNGNFNLANHLMFPGSDNHRELMHKHPYGYFFPAPVVAIDLTSLNSPDYFVPAKADPSCETVSSRLTLIFFNQRE